MDTSNNINPIQKNRLTHEQYHTACVFLGGLAIDGHIDLVTEQISGALQGATGLSTGAQQIRTMLDTLGLSFRKTTGGRGGGMTARINDLETKVAHLEMQTKRLVLAVLRGQRADSGSNGELDLDPTDLVDLPPEFDSPAVDERFVEPGVLGDVMDRRSND